MDMNQSEVEVGRESDGRIGELLHRITDDVKVIAHDEVALIRTEFERTAKTAAADAAIALLGGIVALIGLGLLCVVAVVALEPAIEPLWLRLLIMAAVYLVAGGVVAGTFAKRLKTDAVPDLSAPAGQARRTAQSIREGLRHG